MKKNNKKSKNPLVLGLYGLAILLGAYTILTIYNSYTYISSLVTQGLVISDEILNVISYYVDASAPYLCYTIIIWAIGYIINKINHILNIVKVDNNEEIIEDLISVEALNNEIEEIEEVVNVEVTNNETEEIEVN